MIIELTLQSHERNEGKPALFVIEGNVVITSTSKGYSKLVFPDIGIGRGWVVEESYDEVKELIMGGE
jgi:hypothetical protein